MKARPRNLNLNRFIGEFYLVRLILEYFKTKGLLGEGRNRSLQ